MTRLAAGVVTLVYFTVLMCGTAAARVYVDPDSPSGQEYALPLDDARGNAADGEDPSGGGGGSNGGNGAVGPNGRPPAPAFGVGLDPREKGGDSAAPGKDAGAGSRPEGRSTGEGGSSAPSGPIKGQVAAREVASSAGGGFGSALTFSALGVGTLLVGGATGVMFRRRLRRRAT